MRGFAAAVGADREAVLLFSADLAPLGRVLCTVALLNTILSEGRGDQ